MNISEYISKVEPERELSFVEKIAEATGVSRELVEKYCGILKEYAKERRNR